MVRTYGYTLTENKQADMDIQRAWLLARNVSEHRIVLDIIRADDTKTLIRPALARILTGMGAGDVLVTPSIERLAANASALDAMTEPIIEALIHVDVGHGPRNPANTAGRPLWQTLNTAVEGENDHY